MDEVQINKLYLIGVMKVFITLQALLILFTIYQKVNAIGALRIATYEFRGVDFSNWFIYGLLLVTFSLWIYLNIIANTDQSITRLLLLGVTKKEIYQRKVLYFIFSLFLLLLLFGLIYFQWLIIAIFAYIPSWRLLWFGNEIYAVRENITAIKEVIAYLLMWIFLSSIIILFGINVLYNRSSKRYGINEYSNGGIIILMIYLILLLSKGLYAFYFYWTLKLSYLIFMLVLIGLLVTLMFINSQIIKKVEL